ncbi:MAG: FAD binding domain-containing protein [Syntrophobacterales bacterium]|nr:FAD binding domain-containing protein [Syntrophobacterales bacterium]
MIREYVLSKTIEEAVGILTKNNGNAMVVSGGTDLAVDLRSESVKTEVLVDVTRIEGLKGITFDDGDVIIGASATMSEISTDERIKTSVSSLAKAAGSVGSVQIRNVATMAGNIVKAQPVADSSVMLVALGAEITIRGTHELKDILVQDAYITVGKSVVDPRKEIITKIKFKKPQKNQGTSFVRLSQRKALATPVINVGAMVSVKDNTIEWARIAMAPVDVKPVRATEAENFLIGKIPTENVFKEAGSLAVNNAKPVTHLVWGSKEYKLAVLPSLVARSLQEAIDEIETKGGMS